MKIAFFDCFSGISGDMCLGAIVDAGVPLGRLSKELKKIPVDGYKLSSRRVKRCGIAATKVEVKIGSRLHGARKVNDIEKIISRSSISPEIKEKGLAVFRLLFEAEAAVHGKSAAAIHLHELGAVDCVVDIFGTLIGLEMLGVEEVYASPVNLGSGTVRTAHGILPVPAPATAELLRGIPVYSFGEPFEMTTPTGAALIKFLARGFGQIPAFVPESTGSGAGGKDPSSMPNLLRIIVGAKTVQAGGDSVFVIETNIDDMNPQVFEYVSELLFDAGALDVWLSQIIMKKMRPGVKLSIICSRQELAQMAKIIFSETTSIGLRYYETSRITMQRELVKVQTPAGNARVKISRFGGMAKIQPEYEDCRKLAKKTGRPLLSVMEDIRRKVPAPGRRKS